VAVVVGRIPARQGSYARRRQIGFYHTEKPAKYAHLPARMVLAQKARCHARLSRSFQLAEVCGTVSTAGVFAWRTALKHKFTVGETVYFTASNVARPAASGTYEVIRLLPTVATTASTGSRIRPRLSNGSSGKVSSTSPEVLSWRFA